MGPAKTLAKQIVRIRNQREKIYKMKGSLGGVKGQLTTVVAHQTVAKSMQTVIEKKNRNAIQIFKFASFRY